MEELGLQTKRTVKTLPHVSVAERHQRLLAVLGQVHLLLRGHVLQPG